MKRIAAHRAAWILGGVFVLALSMAAGARERAPEDEYVNIADDLGRGVELQDVADRAYDHAEEYWEYAHGHARDGHEHEEHGPGTAEYGSHDGDDEELSAGEAVSAIYLEAGKLAGRADPASLDIVKVTIAVVDAWPDCQDTFDAVRSAVDLQPERADEIVAAIAVKRDCNCNNGGLWLDQRVLDRMRVEMRHTVLEAAYQCSCSQVAMYGGIAGLPENREWHDDLPDARKAELSAGMTERVTVITERVAAQQSFNGWDCGCTDINIAASMQGIRHDELRENVYEGLERKYTDEAGDTGLVVDSLGIVGTYPLDHWGSGEVTTRDNDLRRKGEVYRGDNLILDPFDPAVQFGGFGDGNIADLGLHTYTSTNIPTDLFISEYLEGWNEEAKQLPPEEREPEQHNRVLELYNGSEETIDLGHDRYFLEIYSGGPAEGEPRTVVTPPVLVKRTISLQSDVTFAFDKSDIRPEASEDLQKVIKAINDADIFSELLIVGHTCDMGSDEYNEGLSERRANSVRDYLRQNGLKDVQVRAEGHGEREPRVPNSSSANRSRNRRVDITFVTREGAPVETKISQADPGQPKKYEYNFLFPVPPTVHEVETEAAGGMAPGEYREGDMDPRQVIGLNGAVEPGETWIIAYSESDDAIRDKAQVVTAQLDFQPNETLVVRRLGGDMALYCRAHVWSHVINYPSVPLIRPPPADEPPPPPPPPDYSSPN